VRRLVGRWCSLPATAHCAPADGGVDVLILPVTARREGLRGTTPSCTLDVRRKRLWECGRLLPLFQNEAVLHTAEWPKARRCSARGTGAFARLARDRARMLFPCVKAVASDRTHIDLVGGGRWEAQYARWRRAVVVLTGVSGADCSAVILFANARTPANLTDSNSRVGFGRRGAAGKAKSTGLRCRRQPICECIRCKCSR
jgi:hypothetical protein